MIIVIDISAAASVSGFAFVETYASIAWVRGVHSGCCCQGRRHSHHKVRVVDRDLRSHAPVNDRHLYMPACIGDDTETGDLRSSSGCCVDCDHRA